MALKVELKPGEKLLIGNCIVTNGDQRARLFIDGETPILREKDILTPDTADSPAKRIYLAVQLMYIEEDMASLREEYFSLVNDFAAAAPSSLALIDRINNDILTGSLYKGLRSAKELIAFEQDLLDHAASGSRSLPDDRQNG